MEESRLPKLSLKLNLSGVKVDDIQANKTTDVMDFGFSSEADIVGQMQQYAQVRQDEKLLALTHPPTQHGGKAIIKNYIGDGLFFTTSGMPMENISGVLWDLQWTGHGREFRRKDGSVVTISVSGKLVE